MTAPDVDAADQTAEIRVLEKTLAAARKHAHAARTHGFSPDVCKFWQGVSGWLRSRIAALEAGYDPDRPADARDWPDAASTTHHDLGEDE